MASAELIVLTLSYPATETVKQAVRKDLAEGGNREEAFRDLFWALLNAKEFAFNH